MKLALYLTLSIVLILIIHSVAAPTLNILTQAHIYSIEIFTLFADPGTSDECQKVSKYLVKQLTDPKMDQITDDSPLRCNYIKHF